MAFKAQTILQITRSLVSLDHGECATPNLRSSFSAFPSALITRFLKCDATSLIDATSLTRTSRGPSSSRHAHRLFTILVADRKLRQRFVALCSVRDQGTSTGSSPNSVVDRRRYLRHFGLMWGVIGSHVSLSPVSTGCSTRSFFLDCLAHERHL